MDGKNIVGGIEVDAVLHAFAAAEAREAGTLWEATAVVEKVEAVGYYKAKNNPQYKGTLVPIAPTGKVLRRIPMGMETCPACSGTKILPIKVA